MGFLLVFRNAALHDAVFHVLHYEALKSRLSAGSRFGLSFHHDEYERPMFAKSIPDSSGTGPSPCYFLVLLQISFIFL